MDGPMAQPVTEQGTAPAAPARRRHGTLRPVVGLLALVALAATGLIWTQRAQGGPARTIAVGNFPWYAALVSAEGRFFVANSNDGTVSVLDTRALRVLRTVPVGGHPGQNITALVADGRSGHVFVATSDNVLTTLDDRSGAVVATRSLAPCLSSLVVDEGSGHLFAGDCQDGAVWMIDARSGRILATTAAGGQPHELEADQRTGRVFLTLGSNGAGGLSVLDASSGRLLRTFALGLGVGLCLFCTPSLPDGPVFATRYQPSVLLYVLDATSGRLLRTVPLGMDSEDRTVDARTGQAVLVGGPAGSSAAFAPFSGPGRLVLLDGHSGRVLRRMSVGEMPGAVGVDTRRQHLLLGLVGPIDTSGQPTAIGSVEVLDQRTLRVRRTLPAGILPWSITVDPRTDRAFLINANMALAGTSFTQTHVLLPEDWWHAAAGRVSKLLPWLPWKPGSMSPMPTNGTVTVLDLSQL